MSTVTSGLRCQLNRMQLHKWRSRSQTLLENSEKIASNLHIPAMNGAVFFKSGNNGGHMYSYRKRRTLIPGVWQNHPWILDSRLHRFKHWKDFNFEKRFSFSLKSRGPSTLSTQQKIYNLACKSPNMEKGHHEKLLGYSFQQNVHGIQTYRRVPVRSSSLMRSVQTCRQKLFICRHISTCTQDQKKKESVKDIDVVKEMEKKGDKSRKTIRKKVQPVIRQVPRQVTVYTVGDELNFESFTKHLAVEQLYDVSQMPEDLLDKVIHVTSRYQPENYPKKDIFFFSEGSVVFWNVHEDERLKILKDMMKHCVELNDMKLIMDESDSLEVQPTKLETFLNNDVININEDEDVADLILVKYAFSNALSQSVKLSIWETELHRHSKKCEDISEALRKGSNVRMDKQKILKTLGAIFTIR
ncbi:required for meiotic nuclear division protein 1 homolog isoform X2 [Ylistrum balloti]|nr:required for meiotic nuclear division protein 1 homolog isoform X2 [Ylistrum balloti]